MIVTGTVVEMELGLALQLVGKAGFSGIATIGSSDREATLVVVDGAVLHASATTTRKLGESLIERGVITSKVLEDALRLQGRKKVKQPIATILIDLGVVTKAVAEAEIEIQITRVLREVFGWRESKLSLDPVKVDTEHVVAPQSCELEALLNRLMWAPARK